MKQKLTFVALMVAATSAMAGAVDVATVTAAGTYSPCDGKAASAKPAKIWGGSGAVLDPATQTAVFTRQGFNIICSGNVFVDIQEESATLAAVVSGSAKGNQSFGGHSNGGAMTASAKCKGTNDACEAADMTAAMTKALADAKK